MLSVNSILRLCVATNVVVSLGAWRLGHGQQSSILEFSFSSSEYTPRLIKKLEGIKIKKVSTGMLHSACIDGRGSVFTFGEREVGKLGFSEGKNITEKVPIVVWRKPTNHVRCATKLTKFNSPPFCKQTDPRCSDVVNELRTAISVMNYMLLYDVVSFSMDETSEVKRVESSLYTETLDNGQYLIESDIFSYLGSHLSTATESTNDNVSIRQRHLLRLIMWKLRKLKISNEDINQLKAKDADDWRFMESLNNCSSLLTLDLQQIKLSVNLTTLIANDDLLTCQLPSSFGDLMNLQRQVAALLQFDHCDHSLVMSVFDRRRINGDDGVDPPMFEELRRTRQHNEDDPPAYIYEAKDLHRIGLHARQTHHYELRP